MTNKSRFKTVGLLLLPFLLVGGLRLWALSRATPHLDKIAAEIGSIPQFRVGLHPNYAGSALLFFQETETGLGTFFCETATGKSHLLYEEKEKGYRNRFRLLGWSPNDTILGFAIMPGDNNPGSITLCKGVTGEVITNIPAGGIGSDLQFVWLSAHSFVYSTYSHRSWLLYEEKPDGSWAQTQVVKRFAEGSLANITDISPHAIAWRNKQTVWTYDFATGVMEQIWETTTNQLTGLSFSRESGNLLLRCKDAKGSFITEFRPPRNGVKDGSIVKITRPLPASPSVSVAMKGGRFFITIKGLTEGWQPTFSWDGMLFSVDGLLQYKALVGENLFFVASQKGGIPEIWDYNFRSQDLRQVTSSLHTPLKWANLIEPTMGVYTNREGQEVSYHLWAPVNKVPGKKYPIVITAELHDWGSFQQAAPNAGWFYAHLDRMNEDTVAWPKDVAGLYQVLSNNAEVDTNKVFFMASSGQNVRVPWLFDENIGTEFGLVLNHPGGLKSLPGVHVKSILMLSGNDDKIESVADLVKVQNDVFNEGNCVNLLIQDGVQHLIRSAASQRRETVLFARFLSQNK